jgi:hypothetical protein
VELGKMPLSMGARVAMINNRPAMIAVFLFVFILDATFFDVVHIVSILAPFWQKLI